MAVEFAEAVRRGDENAGALAEAFAVAVGEALEPVNRLVAAVMAGGPFRVRRALELAGVLLDATPSNRHRSAGEDGHE